MDIQQTLNYYCNNEMAMLKKMCIPMIIKIGGISDKDYDDFFDIALDTLSYSVFKYDEENKCSFDCFLTSNIKRKFKTEIRDRNRNKRIPAKKIDSINSLVSEDGMELSELIPSDFNTYELVAEYMLEGTKIERYLNKLSHNQRKIVALLSEGYKAKEIKELLHMNSSQYSNNIAAIQAYENVKILM